MTLYLWKENKQKSVVAINLSSLCLESVIQTTFNKYILLLD